jgi:hypothetical protein
MKPKPRKWWARSPHIFDVSTCWSTTRAPGAANRECSHPPR